MDFQVCSHYDPVRSGKPEGDTTSQSFWLKQKIQKWKFRSRILVTYSVSGWSLIRNSFWFGIICYLLALQWCCRTITTVFWSKATSWRVSWILRVGLVQRFLSNWTSTSLFHGFFFYSDNIYPRGHHRKTFERRKSEERVVVDQDFFKIPLAACCTVNRDAAGNIKHQWATPRKF